jgi:uncharacterized protein YbbC (DUF1343 family)
MMKKSSAISPKSARCWLQFAQMGKKKWYLCKFEGYADVCCQMVGRHFLLILVLCMGSFSISWAQNPKIKWDEKLELIPQKPGYKPGSFLFENYVDVLAGKKVGLVINHTASFRGIDLVDTLLRLGIKIEKIFAPEHGFRGKAEAGQWVANGLDEKTGISIISLYGKNKKPGREAMEGIDVLLFDIQDVGARFYTYVSTLKLVMEACAENGVKLYVMDRANPLGFCCEGPMLEKRFASFVGAFPIPVVHGLTVGEIAKMAKSKRWFSGASRLKMKVIPCQGYQHKDTIFPEKAPSPNLQTPLSILAYPSLCLFEGTKVSVGRGTDFPFEVFGLPDSAFGPSVFFPKHQILSASPPLFCGKKCFGYRLTIDSIRSCFDVRFLSLAFQRSGRDSSFFNPFFSKLAGNSWLKEKIERNEPVHFNLKSFLKERKKFLLYP